MNSERWKDAAAALGMMAFAFVLAAGGLALSREAEGIAPLWFGNAAAFAIFFRFPRLQRLPFFVAVFGGMLLANVAYGIGLFASPLFAFLNILEMSIALIVAQRLWDKEAAVQSLRNIATAMAAGIVAAGLVAVPAALVEHVFQGATFLSGATRWFAADALGMMIVGPIVLAAGCADCLSLIRSRRIVEVLYVGVAVTGSTWLVFSQARYPALFVLIPALLFATFRLRFIGAVLSVTLLGVIAAAATLQGMGPIAASLENAGERMLFLQAFLAVAVLTTMPLAAVLVEREQHVTSLAEGERRFRHLAERAPLAIFECDRTGRVVFGNERFVRDYGRGSRALSDRIVPEQREAARAAWAKAIRDNSPVDSEWDVANDQGRPCRTAVSLTPAGEDRWIGIAVDIDERHRQEERIALSEHHYRLLADHSNDMIVRIGLDGVRRYVSPASRTILGHAPEDLIGDTPIAAIHPEDRARVERVCRSLLEGAQDPICTYRQRRSDGEYVWLEATYRLVTDANGMPSEFVATVRDIGRRRAAELENAGTLAQLEETGRLLRMAERMVGVGHWRLDAINHDLFWSDEVYRIHGREIGDIPPLDQAIDAYHPDDREMVAEQVDRALREGIVWDFRARLIRTDGVVRHVRTNGQAELAPDGTIVGVVGVFQDITDAVDAEEQLIMARDEARASTEAKSAFLATMSHEIRTPMTGVLGMIDLLRGELSPQDRKRFFDNLEQSASLLMTVLDDVLDFSKIESRNLVLEQTDFDLVEIVRNTLDLFHHAASRKGLLLTMSGPTGSLRLRGDPVRLQQILSNLISNAIKFTSTGSVEVRIRAIRQTRRHRVFFEVVDTGIGISPETAQLLFEPFVQGDESTTRKFGGTGLGLAISRRLVEAMSGTISLESSVGAGTTFRFDVELDEARTHEPVRSAPGVVPFRTLSILLAEDNQINRALVETLVRRAGHSIISVENGRLAVEAANTQAFDLILMDMQMPEMDGVAATRAIRAGGGPCAGIAIVALTADASAERRRFYENVGLTGFLTKPIDSGLLVERLTLLAAMGKTADFPHDFTEGTDVFDEQKLDQLDAAIGTEAINGLLRMLDDELRIRAPALQQLISLGSREAVAAEAHALKGAAHNIGAVLVGNVAGRIEEGCDAGADLKRLGQELVNAAHATRTAIDDRTRRRRTG